MRLSEFAYDLPKELIAQHPIPRRDQSRLLVLNRKTKSLKECTFKDIKDFVRQGDVFVLNDTRVLPARLIARRSTGAQIEILLLKEKTPGAWEVLVKPGKKARVGESINFAGGKFSAEILERTPIGGRLIKFKPLNIKRLINQYGQMPLPNYIKQELKNPDRYQTIYAKNEGAVAAPTAGLHFTRKVLKQLIIKGAKIVYVTLHCGLGTFRPVKTVDIRDHRMEPESYSIDSKAAAVINQAKAKGKRIIAVGTTAVRVLETAAFKNPKGAFRIKAEQGETRLYIYPGYKFKIISALLTNFHLPDSTNSILVSTFAGIKFVRRAYQHAINKRFRFYSFGDAMLIK
ncbi:MAG: tRNA preQ1(34) S-adenosylmethionine ribosyltransferase-isomerase QueA [Candidatus Omnitrophota bacterium]